MKEILETLKLQDIQATHHALPRKEPTDIFYERNTLSFATPVYSKIALLGDFFGYICIDDAGRVAAYLDDNYDVYLYALDDDYYNIIWYTVQGEICKTDNEAISLIMQLLAKAQESKHLMRAMLEEVGIDYKDFVNFAKEATYEEQARLILDRINYAARHNLGVSFKQRSRIYDTYVQIDPVRAKELFTKK